MTPTSLSVAQPQGLRRSLPVLLSLLVAGMLLLAPSSARAASVTDTVAGTGVHDTLASLIDSAGLGATLDGAADITLFAPTDAAFAALDPAVVTHLTDPANVRQLQRVLSYHAVGARVESVDLVDGPVSTLLGQDVTIDTAGPTVNGAAIAPADVAVDNGFIHVIDAVLVPDDIVAVATGTGSHDTLVSLVTAAGLADALSFPSADLTVFAPTDAAFAALDPAVVAHLADPANVAQLRRVLLYHVVAGEVLAGDIADGTADTLMGQTLALTAAGPTINGVTPIGADVPALNGVIHVTDEVFVPQDIVAVATGTGVHDTLVAAVGAAGLGDALSFPSGDLTVFAPTDAAFGLLPEGTVDALLADIPTLTDILNYHVVAGAVNAADLSNGQQVETLQGNSLYVTKSGGRTYINGVEVTTADVPALNGVIHVIGEVLDPAYQPPAAPAAPKTRTGLVARQLAGANRFKRCGAQRSQCVIRRGSRLGVRVAGRPAGAVRGERVRFEYYQRTRQGWQLRRARTVRLRANGQAQLIVTPPAGQWLVRTRLLEGETTRAAQGNNQFVRVLPPRPRR